MPRCMTPRSSYKHNNKNYNHSAGQGDHLREARAGRALDARGLQWAARHGRGFKRGVPPPVFWLHALPRHLPLGAWHVCVAPKRSNTYYINPPALTQTAKPNRSSSKSGASSTPWTRSGACRPSAPSSSRWTPTGTTSHSSAITRRVRFWFWFVCMYVYVYVSIKAGRERGSWRPLRSLSHDALHHTFTADFHPRILYLTGTREQLAKVTKAYRVYFSKARHIYIIYT